MCGRYTLIANGETIAASFGVEPALATLPRYNIAPTQSVVAVLNQNGSRYLGLLRWGLIPAWAKDESIGTRIINARAETLTWKPSLKPLLRGKRCLIVSVCFYEWKNDCKQ